MRVRRKTLGIKTKNVPVATVVGTSSGVVGLGVVTTGSKTSDAGGTGGGGGGGGGGGKNRFGFFVGPGGVEGS